MKKIELLSPVGYFDSLQAAINGGADAIYFGVEQLNMLTRSAACFEIEDLEKIAGICKQHSIRAYITLNTVMFDHDRQLLTRILKEVKRTGIDAVIAADFAVIKQCNELGIPLHISTQANVSNVDSVKFFSRFADVIVLARELTLNQVKQITKEIKRKNIKGPAGELIKIELFGHGALCMAVSGKCYLSLHTQHASANRGACVQNCRRPYLVKDAETGEELLVDNEYIMSPKDLCTIDILDELINSGVDVFKIEGRSKGADYVQVVTKCYREAIDAFCDGSYTKEKIAGWMEDLGKVYNRGFWEGYYLGRKLGEWTPSPGSIATEKRIYIGKASNYFSKIGVGEFILESGSIKAGDTIMVLGPSCGMHKEKMENLIVNGIEKQEATRGDKLTFPFPNKVTPSDKLYKVLKNEHA